MRKLIFLLFLLPAIGALVHDIYIFSQNQEKGFQLSAIGAIWAKYHPESHDQWKVNVTGIGETIDGLMPEQIKEESTSQIPTENLPDYAQNFSQLDSKDKKESVELTPPEPSMEQHTGKAHDTIGLILRQKAVIFFGGIALFLYIINALFSRGTQSKDSTGAIKQKKNAKGGYQYKRK